MLPRLVQGRSAGRARGHALEPRVHALFGRVGCCCRLSSPEFLVRGVCTEPQGHA